jgi:tetratricopeptide (TPR) repeat protein
VDAHLEVNAMEAKGILHVELGQHAESLALHEEVLGRRRELQGELHPELAFSYGNIATAHFHAGRHRQALEWGQRAIDLHARMLGRRHPATGLDLHLQAQILGELGELPEALALAREAREAFEAARGPGHVETATMIELEGTLRLENEEYGLAEERLGEALRIFSEQAGEGSPQATGARLLLAQAQARTGKADQAVVQGQRALDDYLRLFGPQHIRVVNARSILGEILLDEGQHEAARRQLEQALADIDPAFNVGHHGELRFLLARALLEPRVDMVEGHRQLELATRELDEAGESFEYGRRLLAQWRRDHAELLR